jgi:hypothetical protein
MKPSLYTHPRPLLDALIQYGAAGAALLLALLLVVQVGLVLSGQPALLIVFTAITLLLLLAPALMLTTATPAVSLDDAGITLHPRLWRQQHIAWSSISSVKPYPLLPEAGSEQVRKALVGRSKYQPAQGMMFIVPSLPFYYRFTGFFAGEGFTPVIALTNRTHRDYEQLIQHARAQTWTLWQ